MSRASPSCSAGAGQPSTTGAPSTGRGRSRSIPPLRRAIEAAARAVEAIVAKGEPVYGINTGFGKLAERAHRGGRSRAAAAQHRALACRGRRRADAAASRAPDAGAEARQPGAGRLRRAAGDGRDAGGDAREGLIPVVPCQGSVGASGDLAPLAHMAAAMIGVGEMYTPDGRMPASEALARAGLAPLDAGPEGGPGAAQRHAILDRLCAGRAVRGRQPVPHGARHRRALHRGRQGLRRPVRSAHARAEPPSRPGRLRRRPARADGRQRHPRVAPRRRRPRAGSLLPALPAAGDGRRRSTRCAMSPACWRPRPTASPTIR